MGHNYLNSQKLHLLGKTSTHSFLQQRRLRIFTLAMDIEKALTARQEMKTMCLSKCENLDRHQLRR